MLPTALPLTLSTSGRWVASGVPRWVPRIGLTTLWSLALVAAVSGDTTACTPVDPSVCGPDDALAWWIVVCFATPVLLWWLPLAGCAAGVAFALVDLAYDDVVSARIGFGLHGLACVAVAVWLVRAAAKQRQVAAQAAGGVTVAAPPLPPGEDPRGGWNLARLGAVGVLVLAGAGLLGWYGHEVELERSHLARAVEMPATIVSVDIDDISIIVAAPLPDGTSREVRVGVLDTAPYEKGATTPVHVDPTDPSWVRLVAEPQDATGWQSAGLGALLLALILTLRELGVRRARQRLWTGAHPALRVRAIPDDDGNALVLPAEDEHRGTGPEIPVALLAVAGQQDVAHEEPATLGRASDPDELEWDAATQASFGRAWRGEPDALDEEPFDPRPAEPEPAVLLGALHDRGWALLITADGVLVPAGPLRVGHVGSDDTPWLSRLLAKLPFGPWRDRLIADEAAAAEEDTELLPGQPVSVQSLHGEPQLPLVARAPAGTRALGALMITAGLLGGPAALLLVAQDWFDRGLATLIGGQVLAAGVARALQQVRLTRNALEVRGAMRVYTVPWDRLHGVRRDGPRLALAWEPDIITDVGPFDDDGDPLGQEGRAEQLGAAMLMLRERALAAGSPSRDIRGRLGPAWGMLALFAVAMAGAAWVALSA